MPQSRKPKTRNFNLIESAAFYLFSVFILLHLFSGVWDSYYNWGMSHWTVLSTPVLITGCLILLLGLLLSYLFRENLNNWYRNGFGLHDDKIKPGYVAFSMITFLLIAVFFIFRSKALIYGDGYLVLDYSTKIGSLEIVEDHYLQLLAVYFHHYTYYLISTFGGLTAETIFAATNVIGGVVGFWALYALTYILSENKKLQIFLLATTLTSGSIILFFGHIENYTWAVAVSLWALYFIIKAARGEGSKASMLLTAILAAAFHLITLPILLVALVVLLEKIPIVSKIYKDVQTRYLILLATISSIVIVSISQFKGLSLFVPLKKTTENSYALLSVEHLSDVINLLLLLAPIGVVLLIVSKFISNKQKKSFDPAERILLLISLFTFLTALFIDPELGMPRDWDLFALCGFPVTLYGGYRFIGCFKNQDFPAWIILAVTVSAGVHIFPNLYEKNNPDKAVVYLDSILWLDPHYQAEYQEAFRGLSWGYILRKNVNRPDLAEKYFTLRADVDRKDSTPLYNLGLVHFDKNQLDSAKYYLMRGFELTSDQPKFLSKLAEIEVRENNIPLAEKYARASLQLDSNHVPGLNVLAIVLIRMSKDSEAIPFFRKAYELQPDYQQMANLGLYFALEDIIPDSAIYYFNLALPLAPDFQKAQILSSLISLSLSLNNKPAALDYLAKLKQIAPDSPLVIDKEKEIGNN